MSLVLRLAFMLEADIVLNVSDTWFGDSDIKKLWDLKNSKDQFVWCIAT